MLLGRVVWVRGCGRCVCVVVGGLGGGAYAGYVRGGAGGRAGCIVVVGLGGVGRVGGMRRVSFISRLSRNYSRRSSTTAGSFSRSILTSVRVSFLHITIIWSPLSYILTSACSVFLCTNALLFFPRGDRCTLAMSGDL